MDTRPSFYSYLACDRPRGHWCNSWILSLRQALKQWNTRSLVLIPKIPNASRPSELRPITCLNTVYKVISKIQMVLKPQSAFLPGRLLAEILATDLVNGYNSQSISARGLLKVDLRKAFDCVRWDFILASLWVFAILKSYISLISECLSTASFSINGVLGASLRALKVSAKEIFCHLISLCYQYNVCPHCSFLGMMRAELATTREHRT